MRRRINYVMLAIAVIGLLMIIETPASGQMTTVDLLEQRITLHIK